LRTTGLKQDLKKDLAFNNDYYTLNNAGSNMGQKIWVKYGQTQMLG